MAKEVWSKTVDGVVKWFDAHGNEVTAEEAFSADIAYGEEIPIVILSEADCRNGTVGQ